MGKLAQAPSAWRNYPVFSVVIPGNQESDNSGDAKSKRKGCWCSRGRVAVRLSNTYQQGTGINAVIANFLNIAVVCLDIEVVVSLANQLAHVANFASNAELVVG